MIDDQEDVRRALGEMLDAYGYDVALFDAAEAFLAAAAQDGFGCVISDVRMPGMDGISLVRRLAAHGSSPAVILISGQADVPMAVAAMKAGAADFIEKPVNDVLLIAAINRALARSARTAPGSDVSADMLARFARLTKRETEVFDLVADGHTSPSIAQRLSISARTVETYRAQIMEKLQLTSVAALVRLAIRLGRVNT